VGEWALDGVSWSVVLWRFAVARAAPRTTVGEGLDGRAIGLMRSTEREVRAAGVGVPVRGAREPVGGPLVVCGVGNAVDLHDVSDVVEVGDAAVEQHEQPWVTPLIEDDQIGGVLLELGDWVQEA
jgi:hypothetical protein